MKFPLLVLGMHRSGTSCLAGSLQSLGVYLGDVHEWNPHNKKGNREHQDIMLLNEAVLAHNNTAWDDTDTLKLQPLSWSEAHATQRDALIQRLSSEANTACKAVWGFKDPRTLMLLPFWLPGLQQPRYIATFRHPLSVASSLHKRSGMRAEQGLELWLRYNQRLYDLLRLNANLPILCFDQPIATYQQDLSAAAKHLGLLTSVDKIPTFFEPALKSKEADMLDIVIPQEVMDIYNALMKIYQNQVFLRS